MQKTNTKEVEFRELLIEEETAKFAKELDEKYKKGKLG